MPIYLRQILGFITLLGIGNGIQAQDPTPIAAVPHPYKFKVVIDSQLAESTDQKKAIMPLTIPCISPYN